MTEPADEGSWADILAYRDFYDVPRLFCVAAKDGYLVFDSAFDESLDEYSPYYLVKVVRSAHAASAEAALVQASSERAFAKLLLTEVSFDPTRRAKIRIPLRVSSDYPGTPEST